MKVAHFLSTMGYKEVRGKCSWGRGVQVENVLKFPPDILSASMIYGTCYLETEIVKHKVRFSRPTRFKLRRLSEWISTFREIVISVRPKLIWWSPFRHTKYQIQHTIVIFNPQPHGFSLLKSFFFRWPDSLVRDPGKGERGQDKKKWGWGEGGA